MRNEIVSWKIGASQIYMKLTEMKPRLRTTILYITSNPRHTAL